MDIRTLIVALLLAWAPDSAVRAGDESSIKPTLTIKDGADGTTSLAFSPDGKVLAAGNGKDGKVRFWEMPAGKLLKQTLLHRSDKMVMNNTKIIFSPDGKFLASMRLGHQNGVRLWSWEKGQELAQITDIFYVGDIAFTADSKTLVILDARDVIRYDVAKREKAGRIPYPDGATYTFLALSPDGKKAAVNGLGFSRLRIFDFGQAKEERLIETEVGFCSALYWTKDGKNLITAGPGHRISYRDPISGEVSKKLGERIVAGGGRLPTLSVTHDEKLIAMGRAVGNGDTQLEVWEPSTGKFRVLANYESPAFSPDGKQIAAVVYVGDSMAIHIMDVTALRNTLK